MPKTFTSDQLALLHSSNIVARTLVTFWMDDGEYRYCDDYRDLSDGTNTYIGASALAKCTDIKSGSGMAAEGVTITVDGTRLHAAGFTDPGELFRQILSLKLHNRRVDIAFGLMLPTSETITLVVPSYAGKVNHAKVVAPQVSVGSFVDGSGVAPQQSLDIVLDSLAMRYSWITGRTRSDRDQQEMYPGDTFFKFVNDASLNESTLYWGKANPTVSHP